MNASVIPATSGIRDACTVVQVSSCAKHVRGMQSLGRCRTMLSIANKCVRHRRQKIATVLTRPRRLIQFVTMCRTVSESALGAQEVIRTPSWWTLRRLLGNTTKRFASLFLFSRSIFMKFFRLSFSTQALHRILFIEVSTKCLRMIMILTKRCDVLCNIIFPAVQLYRSVCKWSQGGKKIGKKIAKAKSIA